MADIQHVVVLMLENRSFDSMLGRLYPGRPDFDGLTGAESNEWDGKTVPVWSSPTMTPEAACIPDPDPNELFADMTEQIFGVGLSASLAAHDVRLRFELHEERGATIREA